MQMYMVILEGYNENNHDPLYTLLIWAESGEQVQAFCKKEKIQYQEISTYATGLTKDDADHVLEEDENRRVEADGKTTGTANQAFNCETAIKISADNISELRKIDVYRVLDIHFEHREILARFIIENRQDLQDEVAEVMEVLNEA